MRVSSYAVSSNLVLGKNLKVNGYCPIWWKVPVIAHLLYRKALFMAIADAGMLLVFILCYHDTSTKKLTDCSELVSTPLKCILKHVMSLSRVLLCLPESANTIVSSGTLGTLCFLAVCFVQTTLMKRMLAEEMDGGQI